MSHYEERLDRDLSRIKQHLAMLAQRVEDAIGLSLIHISEPTRPY